MPTAATYRPFRAIAAFALWALGQGAIATADEPTPDEVAFFESKVRPILVERCAECHASTAKTVRGGLLLDTREATLKGGDTGPAVVPGDVEESLLVQAIRYDDPALKMPPKGKLAEPEIAVLTEWVKRGAPDPRTGAPATALAAPAKPKRVIDLEKERTHWAYQPLWRGEPPQVRDTAWVRNPIDRFLLNKLEEQGLPHAPDADRQVLARRAWFDLLGLPPTPEEVDAFRADVTGDAFDRLVDRLLESPHYGERWARHWLDLARFAESHGFEHDYDRPTAYHYRDFLIEAFNRDLPFDTFVKWQLAGDEYAPDEPLALKATGFLGAGTHSTQITKNQVEKERYDELDDMVNTTGTAFLGLTIGCARCHDHKYDPITSRDYYRLAATFTTTVRTEVELVPRRADQQAALAKYEAEHRPYVEALARFERDELPGRLEQWEQTQRQTAGARPQWVVLEPSKIESAGGASVKKLDDGSYRFEGTNPDFDTYTFVAACDLAELTAIRIEALADDPLVGRGPGRAGNGNFALTDLKVKVGPRYGIGASREPNLVNAKATFEQPGLPVAAVIDSDAKSGWAVDPQFGRDHAAVFEIGSTLRTASGCTLTFTLAFQNNTGHNIGRLRLAVTDAPRPVGIDDDGIPAAIRTVLQRSRAQRSEADQARVLDWFRSIDDDWRSLNEAVEEHAKLAPRTEGVKAMICSEGLPAVRLHTQGDDFLPVTHILRRGDPNQKEDEATPGFLSVLLGSSADETRWKVAPPEGWRTSYRRRALAEWLTDADQGAGMLLARVIVNRLWQHHFGHGLVSTPSDFGTQGGRPSHPELLDWLAGELIRGGWKLKPIHKLIMTSAAYRQGSHLPAEVVARDLDNTLFGRQERRRLEAEPIRDAMLFVSGTLDPRMFGPGSLDERMRRRSIYFTVKRSQLVRSMTLFDAPDALVPIAARPTTTVAPQALLLINSPVVREWAAGFAARVQPAEGQPIDDAIVRAYRIALSRAPEPEEVVDAKAFLTHQTRAHAAQHPEQAAHLALVDFCQTLLSTNEFLFIE
jgi:hypothetical protein